MAFVVCFGTLFVKIWRLYKVFFNKRMVHLVSDYHGTNLLLVSIKYTELTT